MAIPSFRHRIPAKIAAISPPHSRPITHFRDFSSVRAPMPLPSIPAATNSAV